MRAPYASSLTQYAGISEYEETSSESPSPPTQQMADKGPLSVLPHLQRPSPSVHQEMMTGGPGRIPKAAAATAENDVTQMFANNLRKVSEQLLANSSGRTRTSVSGPGGSRPSSVALGVAAVSPRDQQLGLPHGNRLVSAGIGGGGGGPASIGQSSSSGSDSRPGSQQSLVNPTSSRPASQLSAAPTASRLPSTIPGRDVRPGSYAGPPNTVGLPAVPLPSAADPLSGVLSPPGSVPTTPQIRHHSVPGQGRYPSSKLPRLSPSSVSGYPEPEGGGGLLSTISQAALSDDESPPASHVSNSLPKFNTASLARPPATARIPQLQQPNYENVEAPLKAKLRPPSNASPTLSPPQPADHLGPVSSVPRPERPAGIVGASPVLFGIASRPRIASPVTAAPELAQGRYRAAAAQAKVSTIPEDHPAAAYLPMMRKSSLPRALAPPLATSSPGGLSSGLTSGLTSNGIK